MKMLALLLTILLVATSAQAEVQLDLNDVSYLWPAPLNEAAADQLLQLSEVVSEEIFHEVIAFNAGASLGGQNLKSPLMMPVPVTRIQNWRIASVRIDPCAPGSRTNEPQVGNCRQEGRLVAQPFSYDGVWEYYDFAFHIIFEMSRGDPKDSKEFRSLLSKLIALKIENQKYGIETNGIPLRVHPGFKSINFQTKLKSTLLTHLKKYALKKVTFVGAETELGPWVFFQGLVTDQHFVLEPDLSMHGNSFGEIKPELPGEGGTINPFPSNENWPFESDRGFGPSTLELFAKGDLDLENPAHLHDASESKVFKLKDIIHAVENPLVANRTNTDCFSCHTAMSRGLLMKNADLQNPFRYKPVTKDLTMTSVLRNKSYSNFRMFGWFGTAPIVSPRVINESAHAIEVIRSSFPKPN